MATAEEFKAKGNASLQAGRVSEAIDYYTKAIREDGSNHVYYSNRSAAYLQQNNAPKALEDAEACLGLNPEFAKGYSRKGAALHALKRYNDSIQAYNEGLVKFPDDAGLKKGLASVEREKDGGGGGPASATLPPELLAQMAMDPKLRPYLNNPQMLQKLQMVQANPQLLPALVQQDPEFLEFLQAVGVARMGEDEDDDDDNDKKESATKNESSPIKPSSQNDHDQQKHKPSQQPQQHQEEQVDDWSSLSPEERKVKEAQKASLEAKERGNALYKAKQFDEALAAYQDAIDLDPTNMTFLSNQAAVYFTTKQYETCIAKCLEAVEVGKQNRAPYEDRARAYTRAARAHQKLGQLESAIQMCREAQLESYDKATQRLLKTLELEKRKSDANAYHDDDKAEEAKQRGNAHFRAQEWAEAVREYEEAVKRAPKNAAIRNNLSAALCKIMDFNGAQREIEVALELDPKYVKAWARKGDIEVMMKENHKAMESYKKGLELDPENAACRDGLRKVSNILNSSMTEEERKERAQHAMADPEIQAILQDPVIQQVLRDFNEHPQAAQRAMADPVVRGKIEKLIVSGIVQTA